MNEDSSIMVPEEVIMNKIYVIRGMKVMLDMDLAELYGIETKQLKRAVRRNLNRFPPDFMIELTSEEMKNWRSQFGTSNSEKMGMRIPPFAFTEHGVLMLASVLKSQRAIDMNIRIVRIFAKMREMLIRHQEIIDKLQLFELKLNDHDDKILLIFEYIKKLEEARHQQDELKERKRIGFKSQD